MRRRLALLLLPLLAGCGAARTGVATNNGDPTMHAVATASPAPLGSLHAAGAPSGVGSFEIGYDPATRRLVLQVGVTGSGPSRDDAAQTWAWDGTRWTHLHPRTQLPAETSGAMAVDPVSGRLMYMGGDAFHETDANVPSWSPNFGTWLWDGATWERVADNPCQGGDPALGVDEATRQLLVNSPDIRGVHTTDDLESSGPAWYCTGAFRWTGRSWQAVPTDADLPLPLDAAVAWDPVSRRLIQFGGSGQDGADETLGYDGERWRKLAPANVPEAGDATAATDESAGRIVVVTENREHENLTATWTWDGTSWVRHIVDEPPANILGDVGTAHAVWDPALRRIILAGVSGRDGTVRMWAWDGTNTGWEPIAP
jgi:hypothetical protein